MPVPKEIQDFLDKKKELDEQIKRIGKVSVGKLFTDFFTANPEVEAIRWTQYAPAFNDGDPCVFSIHEPMVRLSGEEDFKDSWDIRDSHKTVVDSLNVLYGTLQELEQVFQTIFGDDSEVTIDRAGNVEQDYCEHD